MALSFEESKKLLAQKSAMETPMVMSLSNDANIMTLESGNEIGAIVAYSEWTRSEKYEWYEEYTDDNISSVDKNKNITVDDSQINISQEENSQFIPFEMPRYYDGFDLMDADIWFYYVSSDSVVGSRRAINVSYDTATIKFGWLVDGQATHVAGQLTFEIRAYGSNSKGNAYVWKTKPCAGMTVLQSLIDDRVIELDDSWVQELVEKVAENAAEKVAKIQIADQVAAAESAAIRAETAAENAEATINTTLEDYYTITDIDQKIDTVNQKVDNLDGLANFNVDYNGSIMTFYNGQEVMNEIEINSDPSSEWTTAYTKGIEEKIATAQSEVQTSLDTYKETVNADLESIHENIDDLPNTLQSDYYNKDQTDALLSNKADSSIVTRIDTIESDVNANKTNIQNANSAIALINETLEAFDKSPNKTYEAIYNDTSDANGGENVFVLYEITNEAQENEERVVKSKFTITGGSGGSISSNTIKIERITTSPLVVTDNDKIVIGYNFIGTDATGDDIGQGNVTWKLGNRVIKTETVYTGENYTDLTDLIDIGSDQKLTLIIRDDIGTTQQKIWYISVVDVKLESTFDDTRKYVSGSPVNFTFTPYGAVDKTVHFLLDGKEIATKTSTKAAATLSDSYTIPAQTHGTHLFEVYMTTTINNNDIESNHIIKDVIWYNEHADVPVIGCVNQEFTARQYESTNITYTVYDPSTETPSVTLKSTYVDDNGKTVEEYVSNLVLTTNTNIWQYKTSIIGTHTLTITCGEAVKTLIATVTELGIDINPTTSGLEFDFNPVGYSNNDENRIWKDSNTDVNMSVSDNFDWVNGGYQIDDAGDQYFCIKAGTTATINYNLFADDAKAVGKEFKVIFKTSNIKKRDTSFISCMNNGIGLDMKVESANIYSSNGSLYSPYCEEDIIEFEFNINKSADIPLVLTYEDGVGNRPMIYTSDSSFWQSAPQPITIGSENCDVHIYRMKSYSTSLSDKDILNNFIADARSAEEMIKRYERNQIYKDGVLNPEYLAEKCPDLRIIMIDAPWFTNDKDNKIDDTNITMIYKNGDPVLDNWTCTGARHRGQGTSSNEYGYASRNIDLVMDTDTSLFTLGDGKTTSSTITLTRDSVPTDYLNVKVNVASSENENNAQHARRYNQFNPFVRSAKFNDNKVKDCMEFYNCVVFVRERDEDISTHREFQDTNYHFYSLGNVGDSKKTDDTRMNNKNDPKECIVEITDYNVPLAEFPTGNPNGICAVADWKAGNTAYDHLYSEYEYEDGEFKSFGNKSYEFRYEMKGITEDQRQVNINNWRDMYKFIVTSTDEEFYARLKEYFVIDSALYYYLYTERYTMVDNRAKNSFWHYGKVYITEAEAETLGDGAGAYVIDNVQAALHDGYRWDLSQGYDFDTSLGIDNTGKLIITYGKEDTDYYIDGDASSSYIYRAAESTFFCRLRDLFKSEMQAMFVDRENVNAWSASGMIKQWDDAQSQFPEELWRLNIQRIYLRTYLGASIDNSKPGEANPRFLTEMMNGRKKYQRRMFERNQELYMATKYFGKTATQDQIMMRFNNPVGAAISPDFTLYLTPYSDMYIGVKFGNVTPTNFRAKAGVEYTIPYGIATNTADITLIYGASFIQAVGNLSRCYVGDNDFSKASRLQRLVVGSNSSGYTNTFMKQIALGNNKLLEYLDIRNVTGLDSVVDLSQCNNLTELRAEGSGATGVIFANGGKLQKAYIPAVTSLTMKNLNYIKEFVIDSYNKLQTLIVEHTPFIDTHNVVNSSPILNILRLVGINWNITDTSILNKLLSMRGINNVGGESEMSVLTGAVHVPVVRQQELYEFNSAWSDLDITYNTLIDQYAVTFKNADGTVLDVQYVDKGSKPVDPITRSENPIGTPSLPSTVSTNYTFAGWDSQFVATFVDTTITATYTETIREYTIKYVSRDTVLQTTTAPYGTSVWYSGDIPTYTAEEVAYKYYLFDGWDTSGYVNGDKIINAVYDSCEYSSGYFNGKELSTMRPVEIYAMIKLGESGNNFNIGDYVESKDSLSIALGNDISYDDVDEQVLISKDTVFNGTNYVDTQVQLLKEDRDFVLAIDYSLDKSSSNGSMLAECYSDNGMSGFRLLYNSGVKFGWGANTITPTSVNTREMIVIRHIKGENGIHVYTSNISGADTAYVELSAAHSMIHDGTLVFGCSKADDGSYENHAVGTIHWSKVWFADLGHETCSNLAYWPHEKMIFEMCGFKRYYLSNNSSKRSSMSFLSVGVLSSKMNYSNSTYNEGGWATSSLNEYLNNRIYRAFPIKWKQLMKQVQIKSSIGNQSTELSSSDCYITIPSVYELNSSASSEPYYSEAYPASTIDYFTNQTSRICYDADGTAVMYWTRSPNVAYATYIYTVNTNGATSGYNYPNTPCCVRIMFSI